MLLAHAKAVEQFRNGNFQGKIGINLLAPWGEPRKASQLFRIWLIQALAYLFVVRRSSRYSFEYIFEAK